MAAFVLRRTAQMVVVVICVVTLVFFLLRFAAGDPAQLMSPPGTSEEVVQQTRERLGTDRPVIVQYADFMAGLARLDLGESFHGTQQVDDLVLAALPNTAALAMVTLVAATALGLLLGVAAGRRPGSIVDRGVLVYVAFAQATPSFWLAVVLVLIFAVQLGLLPAVDFTGPSSFVLPVATLVVMLTPVLIRTIRQSFIDTLGEDYVRAARARGISQRRILLIHTLKAAALPLVTLVGLQLGLILAGSYVVEHIFNWPGIGKLTLDALASRNFPIVQGGVVAAAVVFVLINFVVDLVYGALDPRVRLESE